MMNVEHKMPIIHPTDSFVEGKNITSKNIPQDIMLEIFSLIRKVGDLHHMRLVDKRWKVLSDRSLEKEMRECRDKNGQHLIGTFKNGKLNGQGKIILPSHDELSVHDDSLQNPFDALPFKDESELAFITKNPYMMTGEFKDGELNGEGKIIYGVTEKSRGSITNNGQTSSYEDIISWCKEIHKGEFKNNQLNGRGKLENGDSTYEGEFVNGLLVKGKITTFMGTVSEGEFTKIDYKTTSFSGKLKITCRDGTMVEGEFDDAKLNGIGKMILVNSATEKKEIFEGEFKNTKLNGKGKHILPSGIIFEGEFKDNKMIKGEVFYP